MPAIDIPPPQQERIVCSITAAAKYDVPANIVLAIAEKEGGKPGQWVRNTNGTHDVGPMQFNTSYLNQLAKYGITPEDVASSGCYSYDLAAWRLAVHIKNDKGDLWTKVANYHSRTPYYNEVYKADLMVRANKWADWLDAFLKGGIVEVVQVQPEPITPEYQKSMQMHTASMTYVPRKIMVSSD
ncbi:MAG: hypothetical protein CTY13_00830 [Methylobacter sp.]|nr:MAG: hypothetical protein CTY13_00830 [Methylobacter sp.]